MSNLYFGFDLSTQQLKLLVTREDLSLHSTYKIEFDKDLPHYKTNKGVYSNESTGEIYAPVKMWIEALDVILANMAQDQFPFDKVAGISGSGQQHGSVYWSGDADVILESLNPQEKLVDQISPKAFTLETSPNWQDHSTGEEISKFESFIGGAENLAKITGSRAHYRFTGPQIRKIVKEHDDIYHNTKRITLVSSFLASLLIGKVSNTEEAEACGMNLYDIEKKQWNDELLSICTITHEKDGIKDESIRSKAINELKSKIGDVVKIGYNSLGSISPYYIKKYGFNPNCQIFPFTGDNLATILALPLNQDEFLVSLGTSTTVLLVTKSYIPSSNYHLFIHPTIPDAYMGMICYCNGALAREKVRDELNKKHGKESGDWSLFNELLDKSQNFNGDLGCYFPLGEIVPNAKAQTIRAKYDFKTGNIEIVDKPWDVELDVPSIVESQALSCRARASPMLSVKDDELKPGLHDLELDEKIIKAESLNQRPTKVFYVGGASANKSIVNKISEVLGPIEGNYRSDNANSCAVGGAYKAHWSNECLKQDKFINFHEFLTEKFNWNDVEKIDAKNKWEEYLPGLSVLNKLEQDLVK
ncbi:Glycerol kinase [Wickerhamomyces ciferrii]|uniref:Xylulose kinase n=1 Tax=Wickerhamomyces ciferrii (strain ATCC 14091 / BCRC 22168 / CBS 111 / JCM 3599 / NBRC 0793 / NRRL Y-1031 F-60-10) TaxID=1206466 RepID=K0KPD7_WICCF|nr:Glycerol kinase [Wickerhamomyces ciferrii]CCH43244.1 Glycerol kinase [Wickerhamomyces ciferrii]